MAQISYGTITITDVTDGANANIWTTSVAPTTPNYTFTISNLTGSTDTPRVGDIILQGVYRYTITNINGTTVLAGSRQSLQGATGAAGGRWYSGTGITGTSTTATIFSGSGVANAVVGDMYLNTSTNNVYQCTVAGNASTAKWVYVSNIKGGTGPQGRSTTKVETEYYRKLSGGSAPTSTTTGSTTIPDYIDGCTYYTRTITYFDSGDPNKSEWILNNTLTNEIKNAYDAWIKAGVAESKTAKVYEDNTGLVVASGINGAAITGGTESTYGYNTKLAPTFLGLRYNNINLARLTTTESNPALEFYIPTVNGSGVPTQGAKGLSISSNALTFYNPTNSSKVIELGTKNSVSTLSFYNPSNSNISMMDLTSSGLVFKTSAGAEIGKFGSDTSGGLLELSGRLNIKGGGRIGQDSDNYWEFGDNRSYDSNDSAYLIGKGTASLQLGETGHWRLDKNRIHAGWYQLNDSSSSTPMGSLHFDTGAEGSTTYYWDYGMHYPDKAGGGNNKFLYIRRSNDSTSTTLGTMKGRIDDDSWWTYKFYIDGDGNIHAGDVYSNGTLISGQSAPYLLKSGGTMTGSITMSNGGKFVGDVTGNVSGSASKLSNTSIIGNTNKPVYFTANGVPAAISYEINKSVPSNALFTDYQVQTNLATNNTTFYLAGPDTTATTTGTLKVITDAKITVDGSGKATITATNFNGTASRATADSDGNTIKSTYLKLSGGNVTGAVTFGSSVSVDELTAGDLVVNGSASFTNNLQANTINGVAVGSSPKFTDTNYYHTTGSWGGTNNLTYTATANGGAGALAFTLATATTGAYGVTKLSSATDSTSTTLAATASAVKAAYDLAASKTDNTGTVTSVRVQASSPLQSSSSAASSTTLSTTISFTNQNVNTVLAGPSSGTTAAAPTFRKLVAADIPDISGTYYLASNPSGYTTNTGTVTSVRVQASSPLTSTTNTASSTTLDTTIKFSNQNKNLVLAGPSSGSAAAPTFRSLVADDIPSISKSKISDFPTSLKNPNAIRLNLFNETAARAAANQGTATSYVDYDGSTANQSFSAAGKNALTSIGISGDTLSWVRADGSSGSSTVTITASVASGATVLTDTSGNAISTTGNTTPVWFEGGVPKDVTGIAFGLLPTGTGASNVAVGNHSHGNITNGGDITTTTTIASGDRLVINDESESKINNSSITFGTSTTTFLTNKGTWATPVGTTYTFDGTYNASSNKAATVSTVTNAINALDGGTIGTPSTSKTVTAISQTNGNISVTFGDISITKSQISDFPTSMTPAAHNHSQIVTVGDQRSTATTPNSYSNALIFQGLKSKATVGSPSDDTYSYLVGLRGWSDSSGGNSHELAFNNTGIFWRQGATTSWGNWYRIYTTGNKPTASDVGLGNVTNYDSSVAIKSITRSGTTFTYTTVAGGTGTFTQQDNNTWDALSTSQAGYVAKAPNDTSKFLRGDATWAAVTKANVGLGNVENTALSTWTGTNKITTVGTITTGTWNGSAIPITHGGTGQTTAAKAIDALLNGLPTWTANPTDSTYFIRQDTGGSATYGKAQFSTLWNYISGKISSSGKYVTVDTNQTLTAAGTKTYLGLQTYGSNGVTFGTTSGTSVTQKANVKYDSTLDALVFSFA